MDFENKYLGKLVKIKKTGMIAEIVDFFDTPEGLLFVCDREDNSGTALIYEEDTESLE